MKNEWKIRRPRLAVAFSFLVAFGVVFAGATAVQAVTAGAHPEAVTRDGGGPTTARVVVSTGTLRGVGPYSLVSSQDADGHACIGLRLVDIAGKPPVIFEGCGEPDLTVARYRSADETRTLVYGQVADNVDSVTLEDAAGRTTGRARVVNNANSSGKFFAIPDAAGAAARVRALDRSGHQLAAKKIDR